jgi:predicted permease
MGDFFRKLGYLLRRRRFESELDDEIAFHIESRGEELQAGGLSRTAALAQARREFGGGARAREESRAAWRLGWAEDLVADLHYAARAFRRNPAFAATAIACLALGIGANTTMFSIASEVLFSEPSCTRPNELVKIWLGGNSASVVSDYRYIRESGAAGELAGENEEQEINWRDGDRTWRIFGVRVTDNFFSTIGIPLAMGRGIGPGDAEGVVVTHSFWRQRLGGDSQVLGRKLVLDGKPYSVIGVLPRDHRTVTGFGFAPDLYVPVPDDRWMVTLYARLAPGVTRATARARLTEVCAELDRIRPDRHDRRAQGIQVNAFAGMDRLGQETSLMTIAAFFGMLMIVVGLVLAIACANVASLLMARASSRAQEMAVRLSIGAGRWRLVRQMLAETLLLAVCGTAAGLAMNWVLTAAISRVRLPIGFPIRFVIDPDWRLMAYASAIACGVTLAAGLAPALTASRVGIGAVLKEGQRATGRGRLRGILVAGQLAVSVVLLCAGLLFVRNLLNASAMNPGFDVDHTLWSYLRLVPERYASAPLIRSVARRALERLRNVPGVESVALAQVVPLNHPMMHGSKLFVDGMGRRMHAEFHPNTVTPEYFDTMGIRIVSGRTFTSADRAGAPRVAIVNENLGHKLFGNVDPVGHTIGYEKPNEITIVGVAANGKYFTLGEDNAMAYYEAYAQWGGSKPDLHFVLRAAVPPRELVHAIDRALTELDPSASVETRPMQSALGLAMLPSQVGAILLGSMGVLGLLLAAVGLYGSLLYAVTRRVREIGVRMALGATPPDVVRLVLWQSLTVVVAGLVAGVVLAVFAVRPLAMFLIPEVRTGDVGNFATVVAVLLAVGVAATVAPTLRALRVDPVRALRYE